MIVQKLEPSAHKAGRWLVWLEDGSLIRLREGDVVALGLYPGKELSDGEGEALAAAQRRGKLWEKGLELLAARPMSRQELVEKLSVPRRPRRRPGVLPDLEGNPEPDLEGLEREREALREDAQHTADRLEELGLLNDREYAAQVVRHYTGKGFGPRKLRDELYRRGVPRAYWEEALSQEYTPPEDALDRLVAKKLRGEAPTRENLKRASDYLARRGYGWEEIRDALERYQEQWDG